MKLDDIEREFREMDGALKEAQTAFREGQMTEAVRLFAHSLGLRERAYGRNHSEVAASLEGLADSYYALSMFAESSPLYERLLRVDESNMIEGIDNVGVMFKLGKSLDRQGNHQEALRVYRECARLAEAQLSPGNMLLSNILEGYAGFLKRTNAPLEEVAKFEYLARKSRVPQTVSRRMEALVEELKCHNEMPILDAVFNPETTPVPGQLDTECGDSIGRLREAATETEERGLRPAPNWLGKMPAIMLSLIGISAVAGMAFYVGSILKIGEPPVSRENNLPVLGKEFRTPDGLEVLRFADLKTDFVLGGFSTTLPYNVGQQAPPDARLYILSANSTRLTDQVNGNTLYENSAPELKILALMKSLAAAAEKYYQVNEEYPQDLQSIAAVHEAYYQNPFTEKKDNPTVYFVMRDKIWQPDNVNDRPACEAQMSMGQVFPNESAPHPGAITCGYILGGTALTGLKADGMYIRGVGEDGKFIPSGVNKGAFVIALRHGRKSEIVQTGIPQEAPPAVKSVFVKLWR